MAVVNQQGHKMDDLNRIQSSNCTKIFIQRDYNDGTTVKFSTKFPQELEGKIDHETFVKTVSTINSMYLEAETLGGRNYCESCFACLTAYLTYICFETHFEKMLKKINRYVIDQNEKVYIPRGLMLVDPSERVSKHKGEVLKCKNSNGQYSQSLPEMENPTTSLEKIHATRSTISTSSSYIQKISHVWISRIFLPAIHNLSLTSLGYWTADFFSMNNLILSYKISDFKDIFLIMETISVIVYYSNHKFLANEEYVIDH
ncbi:hypothetical protein KUTeg_017391 [Tegillarca granosa]|uniref:Ras modification protein ERF4 n=1 Tax=Tegillarca granosa TaxID=220873 RepID=A0ABQ9EIG3_TEGGR|nr:hypothetical protein KUTeg_017391 [Tegillarca granosa]